ATGHIRAAMARHMHVVTANKGPIAHAYGALRDEAARQGGSLRFGSSVGDRDDGTRRKLLHGAGGGTAVGDHRGRWGVRRGGLGLGGEDGGAGQRADGRANHAATGDDARDYAADAGARDGDRARGKDGAPGEPGAANQRRRVASGARRGAGAERPSGVHAGNEQPDPVPYGFDGHVRNGVDLSRGGTDGVWRVQRSGELAVRLLVREEDNSRR